MVDRHVDAADLSPAVRRPDALKRLEHIDRRVMLRQALQVLPDTLRSAVVLRDIQEPAYQEIAAHLELPEGTVKSRINRGCHELARQIVKLEREHKAAVTSRTARRQTPPSEAGE